jgi:uncharacterized protein (TIGR03089 family)
VTFNTSHLPRYLQSALSSDSARPRLTYYDDATGERVELSAQTIANWVIKTMNLLIDEVGVESETRVSLHLPAHWLTAVWLIAADGVGARVDTDPRVDDLEDGAPDRAIASDVVEVDTGFGSEVFAVSLAPMAMPLGATLPPGTRDFCAEVRTMPDQLGSPPEAAGTLFDAAAARATELDLRPHERVAVSSTSEVAFLPDLVDGLIAPLAVDGSAVWTRNPDAASCVSRWQAERVTAVIGPIPAGLSVPTEIRHLGSGTG